MIMDILGVENEAEDMMLRLTQEVFGATDPEANATGREYTSIEERMAAMNSVIMESMAYFTALTESRRKEPKNDLASVFANGKINGEPLGDIEFMDIMRSPPRPAMTQHPIPPQPACGLCAKTPICWHN